MIVFTLILIFYYKQCCVSRRKVLYNVLNILSVYGAYFIIREGAFNGF